MDKVEEILKAFKSIEKYDLKPSTIICTVCGCVFVVDDKNTNPCEHLVEMAESCKD